MLLADHQIVDLIGTGDLKISPFDPTRVQPASVDLLLDHFLRVPARPGAEIDIARVWAGHTALLEIEDEDGWPMKPGDFVLASTVERIALPDDLAARVEGKSSLGRLGLAVHVTAGFIDPGFAGQVTLEIANLSPWPIRLRRQMPIAQLCLIPMAAAPTRPYGSAGNHYQGQYGPTESRYQMR
ncbi:dCTP deaminase [Streptomyces sp. NPDC005562]|uniref:dCTP deaminase n=1 Tax=Streptomyces sp. NPDC005562 TaxID=3154890 RepID=UPI0033BA5F56